MFHIFTFCNCEILVATKEEDTLNMDTLNWQHPIRSLRHSKITMGENELSKTMRAYFSKMSGMLSGFNRLNRRMTSGSNERVYDEKAQIISLFSLWMYFLIDLYHLSLLNQQSSYREDIVYIYSIFSISLTLNTAAKYKCAYQRYIIDRVSYKYIVIHIFIDVIDIARCNS